MHVHAVTRVHAVTPKLVMCSRSDTEACDIFFLGAFDTFVMLLFSSRSQYMQLGKYNLH